MAAIDVKSNSIPNIEYIPKIIITSWNNVNKAPTPNSNSNLTQIYIIITNNERTNAINPFTINSFPTCGPTKSVLLYLTSSEKIEFPDQFNEYFRVVRTNIFINPDLETEFLLKIENFDIKENEDDELDNE